MKKTILFLLGLTIGISFGDEGLWPYHKIPYEILKQEYNFSPSKDMIDNIMKSTLRFPSGTGAFVSRDGLVMTNYHVITSYINGGESKEESIAVKGFYAEEREDELRLDLKIFQFRKYEDITAEVKKLGSGIENYSERKQRMLDVLDSISIFRQKNYRLYCQPVVFFEGAEFWLYYFKIYTDIRLVFSPPLNAAFFGGNNDNFVYPSYDLDVAFLRIYEDYKPVQPKNFLHWNSVCPGENELVIASGNPGSTKRYLTYDEILFERDYRLRYLGSNMRAMVNSAREYAKLGPEEEKVAFTQIFYYDNSLKVFKGQREKLFDEKFLEDKKNQEDEFKKQIFADENLRGNYANSWNKISRLLKNAEGNYLEVNFRKINSDLYVLARDIFRYSYELSRPVPERSADFDSAKIHDDLLWFKTNPEYQKLKFRFSLEEALENLGPEDAFVKAILKNMTPAEASEYYFKKTKLDDESFRVSALQMSPRELASCGDPLLEIVAEFEEGNYRDFKYLNEKVFPELETVEEELLVAIDAATGGSLYPDAKFTPRFTYGTIARYAHDGTIFPPVTTLYGLYDRAASFGNEGEYMLPMEYMDKQDAIDLSTIANCATNIDMVGGSSGSPLINSKGEVVGVLFDGNIQTLANSYYFDPATHRALAVTSDYIKVALENVFDAGELLDELESR